MAQDENLALIWERGLEDEELSDADRARFAGYLNMWLFDLENKFVIDRTEGWAIVERGGIGSHIEGQVNFLMKSRRVRDWWQQNAARTFSPDFVSEIERIRNL